LAAAINATNLLRWLRTCKLAMSSSGVIQQLPLGTLALAGWAEGTSSSTPNHPPPTHLVPMLKALRTKLFRLLLQHHKQHRASSCSPAAISPGSYCRKCKQSWWAIHVHGQAFCSGFRPPQAALSDQSRLHRTSAQHLCHDVQASHQPAHQIIQLLKIANPSVHII
jgi:hypothetical protein